MRTQRPLYFDLFDDEIVNQEDDGVSIDKVLSMTRKSLLVAGLVGVPVNTPEQWLCSSPTATRALEQCLDAYLHVAVRGRSTPLFPPPVVGMFFQRSDVRNPYIAALHERLARKRRIRLSPSFMTDGRELSVGPIARVEACLKDYLQGDIEPTRLAWRLEKSGLEASVANRIQIFAEYFALPDASRGVSIDFTQRLLGESFEKAFSLLDDEALNTAHTKLCGDLKAMVAAARETGITQSQYISLWNFSKDNAEADVTSAIVHLARTAMHAGISDWTDSHRATFAAHNIQATITDAFDETFTDVFSKAFSHEREYSPPDDLFAWTSDRLDPTEIEWSRIYRGLWGLRSKPEYGKHMDEMARAINARNNDALNSQVSFLLQLLQEQIQALRVSLTPEGGWISVQGSATIGASLAGAVGAAASSLTVGPPAASVVATAACSLSALLVLSPVWARAPALVYPTKAERQISAIRGRLAGR